MEPSPERQAIAEEAKKRLKLPGIEAIKRLIVPGEGVEEGDYKGEGKNE